jgi:hypothetical protein
MFGIQFYYMQLHLCLWLCLPTVLEAIIFIRVVKLWEQLVFVHDRVVDLVHLKLAIVYKQHQDANATVYKNVYTPASNRKTSGRKQFLKFHVFGLFGHETWKSLIIFPGVIK